MAVWTEDGKQEAFDARRMLMRMIMVMRMVVTGFGVSVPVSRWCWRVFGRHIGYALSLVGRLRTPTASR